MEKIFVKELRKILRPKKEIEKSFDVKLRITSEAIEIESKKDDAFAEYIACLAVDALNCGFDLNAALMLKNEDVMLEKISLKEQVRESRLKTVLGRVIGEKGRTKEIFSELTGCTIAIKDYTIALIGDTEDVAIALHALQSLIRGSPHAKVYSYLERNRKIKRLKEEELGLKEFKKK